MKRQDEYLRKFTYPIKQMERWCDCQNFIYSVVYFWPAEACSTIEEQYHKEIPVSSVLNMKKY